MRKDGSDTDQIYSLTRTSCELKYPPELRRFREKLYEDNTSIYDRRVFFSTNFKGYTFDRFYTNYKKGKITHANAKKLAKYLNLPIEEILGDPIPRTSPMDKKKPAAGKKTTPKNLGQSSKDNLQLSFELIPDDKRNSVALPKETPDMESLDALIASTSEHLKAGADLAARWLKVIYEKKGLQ